MGNLATRNFSFLENKFALKKYYVLSIFISNQFNHFKSKKSTDGDYFYDQKSNEMLYKVQGLLVSLWLQNFFLFNKPGFGMLLILPEIRTTDDEDGVVLSLSLTHTHIFILSHMSSSSVVLEDDVVLVVPRHPLSLSHTHTHISILSHTSSSSVVLVVPRRPLSLSQTDFQITFIFKAPNQTAHTHTPHQGSRHTCSQQKPNP